MVLKFYAVQIPDVAQLILPVSYFFSLLYVLGNLSHNRELVGFQSGGISLFRVTILGLVLGLAVSAVQYFLFWDWSPRAAQRQRDTLNEIRGAATQSNVFREVIYKSSDGGMMWYSQSLDVPSRRAVQVELLLPEVGTQRDSRKIYAAQAIYRDTMWEMVRCRQITFREGQPPLVEDFDTLVVPEFRSTPHQIVAALRVPIQMRWLDLKEFIFRSPHPSETRMAPFITQYYYRMAYPLLAPILFGFAVALGISNARGNRAAPLFRCLVVLFALLIWLNFSIALGNGNRIPAWLAASNPIALFGIVALFLFAEKVGWVWILQHALMPQRK